MPRASKAHRRGAPLPATPPPRRALRWLLWVAGVVVLLVTAAALWWWSTQPAPARANFLPGAMQCSGFPAFATEQGFVPAQAVVDTQDTRRPGMTLIEVTPDGTGKTYRHPSWEQAPSYGPTVTDLAGNIYVAPAPQVSVFGLTPELLTTLFRVDTRTGVMATYAQLPLPCRRSPRSTPTVCSAS